MRLKSIPYLQKAWKKNSPPLLKVNNLIFTGVTPSSFRWPIYPGTSRSSRWWPICLMPFPLPGWNPFLTRKEFRSGWFSCYRRKRWSECPQIMGVRITMHYRYFLNRALNRFRLIPSLGNAFFQFPELIQSSCKWKGLRKPSSTQRVIAL